jgi:hypothetical protein
MAGLGEPAQRFPSAAITIQRLNESRGDGQIDRSIAEGGKGSYPDIE